MITLMLLLFFNLLYLQSSLGEGLSGSTFAGLSAEQLEVQELTRAALLAFVSTGNKGGTLWPSGQWASSAWFFFKRG